MKTIVGGIAIFVLCGAIIITAMLAEEWHLGHWGISLGMAVFGALIYRITRWMRGPGSEFGTPVPSLDLTQRELEDDGPQRPESSLDH